jgi:diaminohydroxyphosphoribosylaminopyrimidine deaminase/5-amino-6-(5-phosphoribosylamino)uracil reductase
MRLPATGRLARTATPRTPVLVISCAKDPARRRVLEAVGLEVVLVSGEKGRVSLPAALEALSARGLTSLMVEGGGEVLGSFLARRLADQVALFRAPLLLGGRGSRPAFGGEDPRAIGEALRLELVPAEPAFPWPWPPQFELWRPRR